MVADKMNTESKAEANGSGDATADQAENAKASSIAGQLMGNPLVLEAIQDRLAGMIGATSGYVKTLPESMQKRVKALKKLQFDCTKIEADFYKEIHELECKYASRYAPIYSKRREIITGAYEPTEEECDWPSDEEEDEEDEGEQKKVEAKEKQPAEKSPEEPSKGITTFWSTTFKNVEMLSAMIQEHDEAILESLVDVTVQLSADPMGFTLEFHFDDNDYFTDKVLTKHYSMRSAPDEDDPLGFDGPEIISCTGCEINWKDGKNVTVSTIKKKQKNAKTGKERTVSKVVQADSFFNFFSPPQIADSDEMDADTEALLQSDYEIGHFIRERIVPHAVMYFTGDAIEDDDDDEDYQDEDDEDYDEDEDPDYNPSSDAKVAAANKECKQQ